MKTKNKTSIAQCLCGGIKIKIKGLLRHVNNCHCSQCLRTHGNYASYTACNESELFYLKKKTLRWYYSSKKAKRGFCFNCGGSVFYKKHNSSKISISAGMFHKKTKLKTYANIFTKNKMSYYKLDSKLPRFNKYFK